MRIAHFVGHSLVRFTPGRISCYWGRYTEHEGRAFAINRGGGWLFQEPLNPQGFYCARGEPKAPLLDWVTTCDVLHCHDDSYPSQLVERYGINLKGKTLIYQAHIGNIPERYWGHGRGRYGWMPQVKHAAITNGYGHLFDDHEKSWQGKRSWGRLPDILDLDHPTYAADPSLKPDLHAPRLRVCYTYSNNREDGKINAKRPKGHRRIVDTVPGIQFQMMHGRPFEEAMAAKKAAHVVLEECFTKYLHLSALEGAGLGACVVTKFDKTTIEETSRAVGAPAEEWPFVYADERTLPKVLARLRDNRELVKEAGERARRWMHRYYTAPKLIAKYLEFYGQG